MKVKVTDGLKKKSLEVDPKKNKTILAFFGKDWAGRGLRRPGAAGAEVAIAARIKCY